MESIEADPLPEVENCIAVRAANEGIPIAAIARIILQPFANVSGALAEAKILGKIAVVPRGDWPPSQKWDARTPAVMSAEDFEFNVRKTFSLTSLETGFMVVLLRQERADKDRLHGVIEQQRFARQMRPDRMELTDPKMVDVMICKLRKKVRAVNSTFEIKTLWGTGYYIEPATRKAILELVGEYNGRSPAGRGPTACDSGGECSIDPRRLSSANGDDSNDGKRP